MGYKPELTQNARPATYTVEAVDETGAQVPTPIAGEHPLTLYVDKKEIVTLMTLGAAPEALALGFLRNQRLVQSVEEIAQAVAAIWRKREDRYSEIRTAETAHARKIEMSYIGG